MGTAALWKAVEESTDDFPTAFHRAWKTLRQKRSEFSTVPTASADIYMLDSQTNSQLGTAARVTEARFYRFSTKKTKDLGFRTPRACAFIGIDISPDREWLYYGSEAEMTGQVLAHYEI